MAPSTPKEDPKRDQATINMSKNALRDRFSLPAASLIYSKGGKLSYGLPDRLCLKVHHRKNSGTGSGSIPSLWTPRQPRISVSSNSTTNESNKYTKKPEHRPSPYFAAIQERERRHGIQKTLARGAARCVKTAYGSRVRDDSRVRSALTWPQQQEESSNTTKVPRSSTLPAYLDHTKAAQRRPVTSPEGAAAAVNASWNIHRQMVFTAASPRFAAHADLEQRRAATPDPEPERNKARLQFHAARRLSRDQKLKAIQAMEESWPHGLPTARRLSAQRKGLGVLGGVGYGSSAQSMPDRQYQALKSTLKLP